jgi:hypothetical protein
MAIANDGSGDGKGRWAVGVTGKASGQGGLIPVRAQRARGRAARSEQHERGDARASTRRREADWSITGPSGVARAT